MNLADVVHVRRIFEQAHNVSTAGNFIGVVRVDVEQLDEDTGNFIFFRKFYGGAEIFCGAVNKKFVGVQEDDPITDGST